MSELAKVITDLEALFSGSEGSFDYERFCQVADEALNISETMGLTNIKKFVTVLKQELDKKMESGEGIQPEILQLLQFALATVKEIHLAQSGDISEESLEEVFNTVGFSREGTDVPDEKAEEANEDLATIESIIEGSTATEQVDLNNLRRLFERFGAEVDEPDPDNPEYFVVRFPFRKVETERLERILAMSDPDEKLSEPFHDDSLRKIIFGIKEFMVSFSQGDLNRSRAALKDISSNLGDGELFNELGQIARKFHDSLKSIAGVLDPHLREYVETKIPDSGNRLEHILKLTENAATTTLDHLEKLQERKEEELGTLSHIQKRVSSLHPLGEEAKKIIGEIIAEINNIQQMSKEDKEDFITILTAQDFQDLTGQIIIKIIDLLHDLETKLIDLIKTFGVKLKPDELTQPEKEEKEMLYGPAHEKKEDALHSQDEVDALLAEFGF